MGPLGVPEMLFILAIALLIFGPKRLPEFGRSIGKALGEFRRATTDLKRSIDLEIDSVEPVAPQPSTRAASEAAAAAAAVPREAEGADARELDPATSPDAPEAAAADEKPEPEDGPAA